MVLNRHVVGKYELGKVLGAGDFDSRTRLCTHTETKETFAVKIYDKLILAESRWMWNQVRESVHIMRSLPKHEHLIETIECFETHSSLYILMQMHSPRQITKIYTAETYTDLDGVELPGPPNIGVTALYFSQAVKGILHLHSHKVVHLGLAPDHVMVNGEHHLRVGFLVSCKSNTKGYLSDLHGTTHTVAPEVLAGEPYDPELADAWALGVLLYFMVSGGRYPHDSANTIKHILAHNIRPLPANVDKRAKELIYGLLTFHPAKRLPVSKIPTHPFLHNVKGVPGAASPLVEDASVSNSKQRQSTTDEWGEGDDAVGGVVSTGRPPSTSETRTPPMSTTPRGSPKGLGFVPRPPKEGIVRKGGSEALLPSSPRSCPEALVDSVWDPKAQSLIITIPNSYFSIEEEAAYLIQHTWKLYKLKTEQHWDVSFPEGVPMGTLLTIRRVDISQVVKTPEHATKRFSRGVSLFAPSRRRQSAPSMYNALGGDSQNFGMFDTQEGSQYFVARTNSSSAPLLEGLRQPSLLTTLQDPPISTSATHSPLPPIRGSSVLVPQLPPQPHQHGGSAGPLTVSNPFQCTSCGRLPPPRASVKGGKPYPDTPYDYSSKSGGYSTRQINTAEKRAEATYQNERRILHQKRSSLDGPGGGSQRPASSSSSSGQGSRMKWYP